MKIRPLRNNIIFQFEQEITRVKQGSAKSTSFVEKEEWGFEFNRFEDSADQPRWGTVLFVGNEVDKVIEPGMRILVEPLKWTSALKVGKTAVWGTNDAHVLCYE